MHATPEESAETMRHFGDLGADVLAEGRLGDAVHYYVEAGPVTEVAFGIGLRQLVDLQPVRAYQAE
jgi:hypothetical protein